MKTIEARTLFRGAILYISMLTCLVTAAPAFSQPAEDTGYSSSTTELRGVVVKFSAVSGGDAAMQVLGALLAAARAITPQRVQTKPSAVVTFWARMRWSFAFAAGFPLITTCTPGASENGVRPAARISLALPSATVHC
jgi:precorrin-6B methylase 1